MISELWSYHSASYLLLVSKHVSYWLWLLNNETDEKNLAVYKRLRRSKFFLVKEGRRKEKMDK